jgi:hypothetical protein
LPVRITTSQPKAARTVTAFSTVVSLYPVAVMMAASLGMALRPVWPSARSAM